ncbi:amine sulfotransferase-like [Limulus polyphemus]|uniref:Amine sulfotransferase-like n=1 Tax=Limulus polyphemus TaxID=6850 RepID=A0ABM1C3X1_LIMPO|nr:amine sulfotransferase-like [Limulus polyphemus]
MAQNVNVRPAYQEIDGFILPRSFSSNCFRGTLTYKARDDDIFIVTFPKCGTTWVQHIVHNILHKGKSFESFQDFQRYSPFMEMTGPEAAVRMPRPGAIKTHLPFHLNPYSPKAKYIYVARNPKDTCVSFYYHTKMIPPYEFANGTFDEYFNIFINGENYFGDYFDHLLSWYEHRNDSNVLFITYEDMKIDKRGAILKIASFLGKEYEDMLLTDEKLMEKILFQTSVEYMKKYANDHMHSFLSGKSEDVEKNPYIPEGIQHINQYMKNNNIKPPEEVNFVRKAVVGDWKNHFTPEQSRILKEKFQEKTKGTDISNLWPNLHEDVKDDTII